jgi:hypothetical protein
MPALSGTGSEVNLLGALNLSLPSNSRRLRQILATAANARKMSQTAGNATDVAALSAPPGLKAPPCLTLPGVCAPTLGLSAPPGLVLCKSKNCGKNMSSGSDNHVESCSTSTTSCSSSDHEDTKSDTEWETELEPELETHSETKLETEESQMKRNLPCFVHGPLSSTFKMQPAKKFGMNVEVFCSVTRLTNISQTETMCRKHKSTLATTLLRFSLPHETREKHSL